MLCYRTPRVCLLWSGALFKNTTHFPWRLGTRCAHRHERWSLHTSQCSRHTGREQTSTQIMLDLGVWSNILPPCRLLLSLVEPVHALYPSHADAFQPTIIAADRPRCGLYAAAHPHDTSICLENEKKGTNHIVLPQLRHKLPHA
ncbi:hypothetical protein GWK47_027816 [Chionoecetes opilio]|uniref:Uncharacterized protein n=1 Tax=Chionoecetes opilio TaxID=41210 RepID=A0A8J8WBF8_CHIOP|nr:hypothetical protein GWK47_027816 [Chionoecetes opilio]